MSHSAVIGRAGGSNFVGFSLTILRQGQGDAEMLAGGDIARCGLFGPVDNGLNGALLKADVGFAERVTDGCQAGLTELSGRGIVPQQVPGYGALPELVEAGRVTGQGGFEVIANLTVEGGALADQIPAVADEQLQGGPGLVAAGFQERATRDGSAVDGGQVGIVGLVAGIDRLTVLLGDKGMEDAGLETRRGEGALRDPVIAARAFNGDHAVAELVLLEGLPDLPDGGVQSRPRMRDYRGGNEQASVKVGEERLGADLGAIKADDAEVFRSDELHAGME